MAEGAKAKPQRKRITLADLMGKVGSGEISEREVGECFVAGTPKRGDVVPPLAINTAAVDIRGRERLAREIGNDLGYRATEAVREAKRVAAGGPAPNGTIVAEGDSWFNLPDLTLPIKVPPTLVDVLALTHPINNIAHWGDTLAEIVGAAEYTSYLRTGKVKYLLFSAGGDDVLGGGDFARFLRQRRSGDKDPKNAPRYIKPVFGHRLNDVMFLYETFVENVRRLSAKTTVIIHGYDFCLPVPRGPWLGAALAVRGFRAIDHAALCRAIVHVMLQRFNDRLSQLAAGSGGRVRYVSLLNTVKTDWWDELHPNRKAARRLATKFDKALK